MQRKRIVVDNMMNIKEFRFIIFLFLGGLMISCVVIESHQQEQKKNALQDSVQKTKSSDTLTTPVIRSVVGRKIGIGFYNCENFFDTKDEPKKDDAEFLPTSAKKYTDDVYKTKVNNIAQVIHALEEKIKDDTIAFIGLVEVENLAVLEKLTSHNVLAHWGFKIVHLESSDPRGIDAALLYNPNYFQVEHVELISPFVDSREVLYVRGLLLNKPSHIFVNHWTSRIRGGEDKRIIYGNTIREKINSILNISQDENIFIMGDFNDNPTNTSMQNSLKAFGKTQMSLSPYLFNPYYDVYLQGKGTSVYQGAWDLFDQIIYLRDESEKSPRFALSEYLIFNESFLLLGSGAIPNEPKRFYDENTLIGGYSDHLPVYIQVR